MSPRRGARYRAVSPDGRRFPFRRSLGAAVRDAVYDVHGWGRMVGGVKISIDCATALTYGDEVVALGWLFDRVQM